MSWGVVLRSPSGALLTATGVASHRGCNNEAELLALQHGLGLALQAGAQQLRIYTDSQWLAAQCGTQQGKIRTTARLAHPLADVRALLQQVAGVEWRWIPRHHNTQADALARQAQA